MAKKMSKDAKALISEAQKKIWRKRRKLAKKKVNLLRDTTTIPVDPNSPNLPEWIQDTPKQQLERYQIENKMQSERIQRLEQKLQHVHVLNNALQSIISSIQNLDRMTP